MPQFATFRSSVSAVRQATDRQVPFEVFRAAVARTPIRLTFGS